MTHTELGQRSGDAGFSLIEAMVATVILSVAVVSLADLLATATRDNMASRSTSRAVILAAQKMEQLKGLAFAVDDGGTPVTDVSSNLAAFTETGTCTGVATGASVGLTPSPPGALATNTDGYVDYVNAQACGLGGGIVPPAGTAYIRRWSIEPSDDGVDTLVLQVLVTERGVRTAVANDASRGRMPQEARLVSAKTRRMP